MLILTLEWLPLVWFSYVNCANWVNWKERKNPEFSTLVRSNNFQLANISKSLWHSIFGRFVSFENYKNHIGKKIPKQKPQHNIFETFDTLRKKKNNKWQLKTIFLKRQPLEAYCWITAVNIYRNSESMSNVIWIACFLYWTPLCVVSIIRIADI